MDPLATEAPVATSLRVTGSALEVELADGRALSVPLEWYPRLANGSPGERQNYHLTGRGVGIHWPEPDEDISIAALLACLRSGESASSLEQWLKSRRRPPNKVQPATFLGYSTTNGI